MISVVEQLCERLGTSQAVVIVEADGFEETSGLPAKHAVSTHAVKMGMSRGGICDNGACYGVDEQGKTVGSEGVGPIVRYRRDYTFQEGI
jgi:hypothetical protein